MKPQVALHKFLDNRAGHCSPKTLTYYEERIGWFLDHAGVKTLGELSHEHVSSWLAQYPAPKYSPATRANYYRAIRVFFNWLYRVRYMDENPMLHIHPPASRPRNQVVTFTKSDLERIFRHLERPQRKFPLRDVAIISLLVDTGIRVGELTSLHFSSVSWPDHELTVDGKTGLRVVPFSRKVYLRLKRYLDKERRAEPAVQQLFVGQMGVPLTSQSVTKQVRRIVTGAGLDNTKAGPHTFRHTFGVEYIRGGGDAFTLQRLMGHSTLEQTRVYVSMNREHLRQAHARYSPGNRLL